MIFIVNACSRSLLQSQRLITKSRSTPSLSSYTMSLTFIFSSWVPQLCPLTLLATPFVLCPGPGTSFLYLASKNC